MPLSPLPFPAAVDGPVGRVGLDAVLLCKAPYASLYHVGTGPAQAFGERLHEYRGLLRYAGVEPYGFCLWASHTGIVRHGRKCGQLVPSKGL